MFLCHPERSEGSPASTRDWLGKQILRCAQDDMVELPILLVKTHHRVHPRLLCMSMRRVDVINRVPTKIHPQDPLFPM